MLDYVELLKAVHYDPGTGIWTRLIDVPNCPAGQRADVTCIKGAYRRVRLLGKSFLAHRLAVFYMTGKWPPNKVDHRDTDGTNNRWTNLREATQKQNSHNSRTPRTNKSGFKGVFWSKGRRRWCAQIKLKKNTHLGYFDSALAAHEAYVAAAQKHRGEFARVA